VQDVFWGTCVAMHHYHGRRVLYGPGGSWKYGSARAMDLDGIGQRRDQIDAPEVRSARLLRTDCALPL